MKKVFRLQIITLSFLTMAVLLLAGCSGISYTPGASFGYFIWEENGRIFVEWSAERTDTSFTGTISTDGEISSYRLKEWEEDDVINVAEDKIKFTATLSSEDYSDGFNFKIADYDYIEFDLKINDEYELSRINVGGFLENPRENVFRIDEDYFNRVREKPWYSRRPFSEFFYKLYSNKYFTFVYIFILGIIVIEILRITVFERFKRKIIPVMVSYAVLVVIEVCIYYILKILVR
ncbi:MAG: hypothetical protein PHG41_04105 [Actinomycetota bacterium]|nr:hypothetical protein [Actinomycetota bacterium]